jgi:putative transposase
MAIKHSSHARYELWYHVVWATKYRKRIFNKEETKHYTKELLREIARQYDLQIETIEVISDHVHFTLSTPPRIAPSRAIQILKSVSTRQLFKQYPWLKKEYWGGEIWIAGYFIRTIGPGLTKEAIEKYILEQSEEI